MGFTPEPEILRIVFDGTSLDGLIVKAKCCSVGEWRQMLIDMDQRDRSGPEIADANDGIVGKMLGYITEWNLEFDGEPAPVSMESFDKLSQRQGAMMVQAWQKAMMSVPQNSSEDLNNGEPSLEQQLGLDSSLESLPNWPPQN